MLGRMWRGASCRLAVLALTAPMFIAGLCAPASAASMGGGVKPFQTGMQEPVTPVAVEIQKFYDLVNYIIIAIAIFVLILMLTVMFRFSEKRNPTPSRTSHNTMLEVAWTVVPILILVVIAIPSFKLLNMQYAYPKPDLTIKATGYAWYWSHEYPDQGGFSFDSVALSDEDRQALIRKGIPAPRLLAVDNDVIVPVGKVVHVLVTAADVIHSWTVPAFGSNTDAVPGRVTSTWFQATKTGMYYGDCTQLCGKDHSAMPIGVRVVTEDVFNAWAGAMKAKDKKKAKEIIEKAALDEAGRKNVADAAPQDLKKQ